MRARPIAKVKVDAPPCRQTAIVFMGSLRRQKTARCAVATACVGAVAFGLAPYSNAYAGDSAQTILPELMSPFDYYARLDVLSDLIERGISRTRHQPTARGSATMEIGNFYITGYAFRINNSPAGARNEVQAEIEAGYEKRFGNLLLDLSVSQELGDANDQSRGTTQVNLRSRYDISKSLSAIVNLDYAPYDDGHQILYGSGGLRLRLTSDLSLHGQIGRAHYFDGLVGDYMFWQGGFDYRFNDYISAGLAYHGSTLSDHDCILAAESHSAKSCGAGVLGRLTFKLYRDDIEGPFRREEYGKSEASDSPPLDVLAKKLPRKRTTGDDDE